jgi:hypothetical protein
MAMTNEDYIKEKGFKCPFCHSKDIKDHPPLFSQEDLIVTVKIQCGSCYKWWNEVYILTLTYYSEITP